MEKGLFFQSDEELLFEFDALPNKEVWYNTYIKSNKGKFELWISKWDILNDLTEDKYQTEFLNFEDAKKESLILARKLNRAPLQKVAQCTKFSSKSDFR